MSPSEAGGRVASPAQARCASGLCQQRRVTQESIAPLHAFGQDSAAGRSLQCRHGLTPSYFQQKAGCELTPQHTVQPVS